MDVCCPHCEESKSLPELESAQVATMELACESCGGTFRGGLDETEIATMLSNMLASISALATVLPTGDSQPNPVREVQAGAPQYLGHFRLDKKLGEGACGTVYKACDTKLDRTVAIKIPRSSLVSDAEAELFIREARAAAQLRHSNIVSVHEVSKLADRVYIVSDFIEGMPLDERMKANRFSQTQALELFVKIAEALDHAHQQGVVHRDLKPANILLDKKEEPYVADFGLAKRDSDEQTIHNEGSILGTPAYMAPEQAQGHAHTADRRADVYSLGVILYELLTGKRPFQELSLQSLLVKIVNEPAPSPRTVDKNVPKDLETICLRCLEKEPSKRFESAQELADEIRRFLKGEPILSRPINEIERLYRWCQRNPTAATLFAAVVVTGLLGGVVSGTYNYVMKQRMQAESQKQQDEMARKEAEMAMERAAAAKLRASQEPNGWPSRQVDPGTLSELEQAEAMNSAFDEFQKRRTRKRQASQVPYNTKDLTQAVLGLQSGKGSAEQLKMLDKLEGDLQFLNQTLGGSR